MPLKTTMHPKGATLVIVAIAIAGFLTLLAFAIDMAGVVITRARLQAIAETAADVGIARVSDLILEKAIARNPDPPEGANPLTVLTEEDRSAILADMALREKIESNVTTNREAIGITTDAAIVAFPSNEAFSASCIDSNIRSAELRVSIGKQYSVLFPAFVSASNGTLAASSVRSIQLCPS